MKMFLIGMDQDHSQYLRELVDRDRLDRLDKSYINSKRAELKAELKKLEDLEKSKHIDQSKIHELLKFHSTNYRRNAEEGRSEVHRIGFIEKQIMPKIKKLGYQGSPHEVDQLLLNWPEE